MQLAVGHHGKQRIRQAASSRCLTSGTVVSMRLRVFGLIVAAALATPAGRYLRTRADLYRLACLVTWGASWQVLVAGHQHAT